MTTFTILLILLSIAIAGGLSFYQYFYKSQNLSKTTKILAFLRFFSILGILILLINPIISKKTYEVVKTPLAIVVDNSSSIKNLETDKIAKLTFYKLLKQKQLNDKFEIQGYTFDKEFQALDKINFAGKQSNIATVAKNLKEIHKNINYATVLITDGNQTSGDDYVFAFAPNRKVFPIIMGDTTTVLDLRVSQINANKYAFHKNKFPVEVFLNYSGNKTINANFSISQGNRILSNQTVSFSSSKKSQSLSILIPADKIGSQIYTATITTKETEKNKYNNSKKFVVDVLDQRTEIGIVSAINHPDLGALKRSIETNASRKVTILKPNEINNLEKYNVLILYQPTNNFKAIYDSAKNIKINTWTITGTSTDFNFLNQNQQEFSFKMSSQKENYLATYLPDFNLFAQDNIGFDNYPPLDNLFGTITPNTAISVLLSSRIRNIETQAPLLTMVDKQGYRSAYLFGENIWKWRGYHFASKNDFTDFDLFIDKIIQYLASNTSRKSLIVDHQQFYNSGDPIEITAQYFNKNYELDLKARLTIIVKNKSNGQTKQYDMLRNSNAFKSNLDGLAAGQYSFVVKELNSNASYTNGFEIIEFDIEKQFVNPDYNKLKQLASQTRGMLVMPNKIDELIQKLLQDKNYQAIEKAIVKKSPLIDWYWLLVFIAISLLCEWVIRKYNGML